MKTQISRLAFGALLALASWSNSFGGDSTASNSKPEFRTAVVFFEPEKFTDVRDSALGTKRGRDDILDLLKDYIQERAQNYVGEGEQLSITITDVDLAGEYEPQRSVRLGEVRIIKDTYPPRIHLTFKLTQADGTVIKSGERELRDLLFMQAPIPSAESYRYEKAMIDNWLRTEFPRSKKN